MLLAQAIQAKANALCCVDPHTPESEIELFKDGMRAALRAYAWWRDGVQYVGTTGRTLAEALKEVADG